MLFDDPATLDPGDVLNWFDLCSDGLAREEQEARLLGSASELPVLLLDVLGLGASREDVAGYFTASRQELELAAVLTLTAAAEARIRLDAALRLQNMDDLAKRLRLLRSNARTEWHIPLYEEGIVDAWKLYIRSLTDLLRVDRARLLTAIGRFKNLLNIRHWVAHGRYWQLQRGMEHYSPADAAGIVVELYDALRRVADHGSLMPFV
ncbi:MAG: hypothetical protein ACLQO1_13475 [Steroidobacteraceae bacterium]